MDVLDYSVKKEIVFFIGRFIELKRSFNDKVF